MFVWIYLADGGQEIGTSEAFLDRESAEAWLAESWPGLQGRGVEEVELVDRSDGSPVYRMSLSDE
jgi:hypothetical protein